MTNLLIPETLRLYLTDSHTRNAVDGLLPDIHCQSGKSQSFPQASDLNTALHIAAQTRFEYVNLMFKLWKETWGQSKFGWSDMDRPLDEIWESAMVGFTLKSHDGAGRDYEGYLYFEENLELHLYKVSTKSPSEYPAMKATDLPSKSWIVADDEEGLKYALFATEHTSQFECLDGFEHSVQAAKLASFEIMKNFKLV